MNSPRLLIAAPSSGGGKTTITTGVMAALSGDMVVQGFKVGPDYIDPSYHTVATDRISHNIDTWMLPVDQIERIYFQGQQGADISIIEGVMGLFDGIDGRTERGSSAEVAKLLNAPVIVVVDVRALSRSAGAIALGIKNFDPALNVAGVIANRVGSPKHAQMVTDAIEGVGLEVIGCIPSHASLNVPERHLGLFTAGEREEATKTFIQEAKKMVLDKLDIDRLVAIAKNTPDIKISIPKILETQGKKVRIAVARDEAFCFYYQDNFNLLEAAGAETVFFSLVRDDKLPENISGLYLGGGYPELYAAQIANNASIRAAIRQAILSGLPTYAECGGLMTLTNHYIDSEGTKYPMVDVVPGYTQMTNQLKIGYLEVLSLKNTLLLKKGAVARGHEFHYSEWVMEGSIDCHAYVVKSRDGSMERLVGFTKGNLLVSYVHIHFASNPDVAADFVAHCELWKNSAMGKWACSDV